MLNILRAALFLTVPLFASVAAASDSAVAISTDEIQFRAWSGVATSDADGTASGAGRSVLYFPSASDPLNRQGFVRVVNHSNRDGTVSITAFDDAGQRQGPITLALDALQTVHFNSSDLEDGNVGKGLRIGAGGPSQGDWRLELASDLEIKALSYIRTSDGFVTSMHDVVPNDGNTYRVAFFMRIATPLSAVQVAAGETGMSPNAAAEGQARRYYAAIGRVVLANHAGNDFWSNPDIFVEVQRRDPEVLELIRRAENRLLELAGQQRAVDKELESLKEKKRSSELTPGKPLSSTQVARLDELSRSLGDVCDASSRRASCTDCSRYDERPVCVECEACNELRFLQEKKTASEIIPGPPLTPAESERLQQLEEEVVRIASERRKTQREEKRLRDAITGNTHTITTPGYLLDFGGQAIQEVFPGDEVWVAVYDRDVSEHDLYGSTALRMKGAILQGGEVELAMPNVKSLIFRIVQENRVVDGPSVRNANPK